MADRHRLFAEARNRKVLIRVRPRVSSFAALALALLIAQVGALLHGYTHSRSSPDPVGVGTTAGQICDECLAFTPLLAAVGTPEARLDFHPPCAHESPLSGATSLFERRPGYAFRSRAPPRLV